jgi:hypothetical protein
MKKILFCALLAMTPVFTFAETLTAQKFIESFLSFTNEVLIPFSLGIAFLLFAINAVRFFVIQGASDEGHEKAKSLAIYSVLAFVILVIFWGVVNMFASSIGFSGDTAPTPDYLQKHDVDLNSSGSENTDTGVSDPADITPPE